MQENIYSLKNILESMTKYKKQKLEKRLIFDKSTLGGIGSKWIILLFFSLPLLEYALIFNPYIFERLGIAQAIIFFVVFLSIVMILIFTIASLNNASVVKKITPSWNYYFPTIDLKLIVTSAVSPYKLFYEYASKGLNEGLEDEAFHDYIKEAFLEMQEENKELLEAMERNKNR